MMLFKEKCSTAIETFETGGGYFVIKPVEALSLDLSRLSRAALSVAAPCEICGKVPYMTGVNTARVPLLAGQQEPETMGLYRTVQEFGNYNQKRYDLIAGDGLVEAMKRQDIKGALYARLMSR